jgi:hypothetical protein
LGLAVLLFTISALGASVESYVQKIVPLIAPAKLATLSVRGANPRIQKITYWLAEAKIDNTDPAKIAELSVKRAGYANAEAAGLTKEEMLRNLSIAEQLGCLDVEGLARMRRGGAPTVQTGPYKGQVLSVDHIIPRSVAPELDNVIANLELLPLQLNESKNDKVGDRQRSLAEKFYKAGLLSEAGVKAVRNARK